MKSITIFTPTFNRAYCLDQLYVSLVHQTNQDFMWLIIDDGSSDTTKELVQTWIDEHKIEIEYIYKPNGGMHTAHNTAYENIKTELNVCIDSDDLMTTDAVEKILSFWNKIKSDDVGGIYALDIDKNNKIIGEKFPDDLKSFKGWGCKTIFYNEGKAYNVKGDKKFISVTKILQKYPPIPVFEGEKYYSLYYKQHLVERDYTIYILNEPVCIVEYLPDGSSMNMFGQYIKNARGFQHSRLFVMGIAPTFKLRFEQAVHYVNSCLILKQYNFFKNNQFKFLTLIAIPPGIMLFFVTKYMSNKLMKIKTQ